jgi:hypothetical protein
MSFSTFQPVVQTIGQIRVLHPGPFLKFITDGPVLAWPAVVFGLCVRGHCLASLADVVPIKQLRNAFAVID